MSRVKRVQAVAAKGLEGDRYLLGTGRYAGRAYADKGRHVTLIKAEVLEALAARTGIELTPAESRRNIATRDVSLNELVGERFYVGDVLCEGVRLCEPCLYLVEVTRQTRAGAPDPQSRIARTSSPMVSSAKAILCNEHPAPVSRERGTDGRSCSPERAALPSAPGVRAYNTSMGFRDRRERLLPDGVPRYV